MTSLRKNSSLALALGVACLMAWTSVAWAAIETRFGVLEYRITVNNKTGYAGTLRCSAFARPHYRLNYASAFNMRYTATLIQATTKSTVCIVRVAYKWSNVDPAQLIDTHVGLDTSSCTCSVDTFSYMIDVESQAYPANGLVKQIFATIDI